MATRHEELRAAFVRAICEEPSEDAPRLVFADWLTEHDEPEYGEFIRVQCELARLQPDQPWHDYRYRELRGRDRELLMHPSVCVATTINLPCLSFRNPAHLSRGFVASVECCCADWLEHGRAVVLAQPVERVRLVDKRPALWGLAAYAGARIQAEHWAWATDVTLTDPDYLPQRLEPFLRSGLSGADFDAFRRFGGNEYHFRTEQAALDALSRAAVQYARQQAGLPPLPESRLNPSAG